MKTCRFYNLWLEINWRTSVRPSVCLSIVVSMDIVYIHPLFLSLTLPLSLPISNRSKYLYKSKAKRNETWKNYKSKEVKIFSMKRQRKKIWMNEWKHFKRQTNERKNRSSSPKTTATNSIECKKTKETATSTNRQTKEAISLEIFWTKRRKVTKNATWDAHHTKVSEWLAKWMTDCARWSEEPTISLPLSLSGINLHKKITTLKKV